MNPLALFFPWVGVYSLSLLAILQACGPGVPLHNGSYPVLLQGVIVEAGYVVAGFLADCPPLYFLPALFYWLSHVPRL